MKANVFLSLLALCTVFLCTAAPRETGSPPKTEKVFMLNTDVTLNVSTPVTVAAFEASMDLTANAESTNFFVKPIAGLVTTANTKAAIKRSDQINIMAASQNYHAFKQKYDSTKRIQSWCSNNKEILPFTG